MDQTKHRIHSIQFLPGQVVIDYGDNHIFQICKACKDGKHFKNFLNDFYGDIDLSLIDAVTAIRFERRFYHHLTTGWMRGAFQHQADDFHAYVKRRCDFFKRQAQKKACHRCAESSAKITT